MLASATHHCQPAEAPQVNEQQRQLEGRGHGGGQLHGRQGAPACTAGRQAGRLGRIGNQRREQLASREEP